MTGVQPTPSARWLLVCAGIAGICIVVAIATDLAVTQLSPAKLAFVLGGFALLIPTLVVKDAKAYWLFLLVLSIPFDISKWLSAWLVDPEALVDTYGMPASGTLTIELYLTDVVLVAMLLPWLARVCLRRDKPYFPRIGYLFVLYLAWALLVSLINAESLFLAMFELCREALYFLFFVYLINNLQTRLQLRSVVLAVFLGSIISAGSVIAFFEMGIGTETSIFAGLHDQPAASAGPKDSATPSLTINESGRNLGSKERGIKRSQGMFRHPAIPASLCGLILPVVLAYLLAARSNRDRILLVMVFALGFVALLLTFSRAGLIGLIVGTLACVAIAGWSGLVSRRVLKLGAVGLAMVLAIGIPFLLVYIKTRPEAFFMRFTLAEAALRGYSQHPLLGVGLNNGTAAMKAGRRELRDMGIPIATAESADSYYLAVLTEVGPVGSILFFAFFGNIVLIARRALREVAADMKPLLVGVLAGLASLATQSLADIPLAGHAVSGIMWLYAALIIAIARWTPAEQPQSSSRAVHAAPVGARSAGTVSASL
jgi:hypothetical protein